MRRCWLLLLCGLFSGLLLPMGSEAQLTSMCRVDSTTPSLSPGQRVPCSVLPDGGQRMHLMDQLGGEHVDPVESLGYIRMVPGVSRSFVLMTDVTTDTSSATSGAIPTGGKTFFASIAGTGSVSVTVTIWGDYTSTATEEFLICTMSVTGTTTDAKKCTQTSDEYPYYHAKTASISGTGATVQVWAQSGWGAGGSAGGGGGDASEAEQQAQTALLGAIDADTSHLANILVALRLMDDDQTGASNNYKTSAGTTEDETEIKATAGRLMGIQITNTNAAARYFRCADLTAANTTPGTSTVFYGLAIPGATTGAGVTVNFGPTGLAFSTALTCWVVTGVADTDVAEVAADEIKWNIQFK